MIVCRLTQWAQGREWVSWLQITIYRKGHMGTDHFIGEIVVPLREVEEVDGGLKEADIRRYTLGRRSAKDKV